MKAQINFRNGGFYLTEIEDNHTSDTLAQRMCGGGFVICKDARWGTSRKIIVNLSDVSSIVLTEEKSSK